MVTIDIEQAIIDLIMWSRKEVAMRTAERLRDLACNLYWTWHPEIVEIFRDLDPALWRKVNHNPVDFLSRLPVETIEEKAGDLALETRITHAFHQLQNYLESRSTWGSWHAGLLRIHPVAYFSAEFGLHESLPIYSGGLGVLAGDHLKSASDLGVPLVGVGLFYAKGYFTQRLGKDGWQEEEYFTADAETLPLSPAKDSQGNPLRVTVQTRNLEIAIQVHAAQVGRNQLLLLDTNLPENSEYERSLTARLYGGDNEVRIRQELILGVGGMRALAAMGIQPSVVHLNEGHSAFGILALCKMLMDCHQRPFNEIKEKAAAMTVFTTHTPVEAGHDRFHPDLVESVMGPVRDQLELSEKDFLALGRVDPNRKNEEYCMTVLGLKMSRYRNGVSDIHGRVSRAMWHSLWPDRHVSEVPIGHITNGVHMATWLSRSMAELYRRFHGTEWWEHIHEPKTWAAVEHIDEMEFWEQRQILKTHLIEYVRRCVREQNQRRGTESSCDGNQCLHPNSLTIGFARRFASYKRAALLLSDLDRLDRLVNHPERPVQIIYAGKAHPRDDGGKKLVQKVFDVTQDPRFAGKIIFLEDHDINVARHLVQGVDLWLNTPRRPREACGTSGQKVVLNGGLHLSVLDGWWAQAYDGTNGFAIGGCERPNADEQDRLDMEELYEVLENQVTPLFYERDEQGIPQKWVAYQKNAIRSMSWRFSARRMVMNYTKECYLPAAGGLMSSSMFA
jgi:starch phosphorylase